MFPSEQYMWLACSKFPCCFGGSIFPRKSSFSRLYYHFVPWGLDCNSSSPEASTGFPGETLLFALLRKSTKTTVQPLSLETRGMWQVVEEGRRLQAWGSSQWGRCSLDGSIVGFSVAPEALPGWLLVSSPLVDSCRQLAHVKPFIRPLTGITFAVVGDLQHIFLQ